MVVECVTLATNHLFKGNPIAGQHYLRYKSIIQRQDWDVPSIEQMEYDQYDNPSTVYFVWRDENEVVRGTTRLCPTDRPFMLSEIFLHMVDGVVPTGKTIMEGSRFCIDKDVPLEMRLIIAKELVLSYLEYGLSHNIQQIVGVMYPVYWNNLFTKNGWQPDWLGDVVMTPDGKKSRAASLPVNEDVLRNFYAINKIAHPIIRYSSEHEIYSLQYA